MKIFPILFLLLVSSFNTLVWAQGNDPLSGQDSMLLENERIPDIIDSDKPKLPIPTFRPDAPEIKDFSYQAKDYYFPTSITPPVIEPQSYDPDKIPSFRQHYVKLGLGRYITPLLKVRLHNGKEGRTDWGIAFDHLSAHKDALPLRRFRQETLQGYFTSMRSDRKQSVVVDFQNGTNFLYGNAALDTFTNVFADSLRRNLTRVGIDGLLQKANNEAGNLFYEGHFGVKDALANLSRNEFQVYLTPKIGYNVNDNIKITADPDFRYLINKQGTDKFNRFYMKFAPSVQYQKDRLFVQAGVGFHLYTSEGTSTKAFVPVVEARYWLKPASISIKAYAKGGINPNSLYDLLGENRYLTAQPQILPTTEKWNIGLGSDGKVATRWDYSVKAFTRKVQNQYMYSFSATKSGFEMLYDSSMNHIGVNAELNYSLKKTWKFGGAFAYNHYKTSTQKAFYHASPLEMRLSTAYQKNKLSAQASLYLYGKTPIALNSSNVLVYRKLFPDMNLSADYRFTNRFSAFVDFHNLFNAKFQRWAYYQDRPLDFRAGITWIF